MSSQFALVIEDDRELSRTYKRVLVDLGYNVEVADSIADARLKIRSFAPALLLVDIELPDGNGLDLMNELRNSTRERFIVISGNSSQLAAIKSIRHRAVEFVTKPVSLDELRRLIGKADPEIVDCWINQGNSPALVKLRTAISFSAELRKGHALIFGEPGLEKRSIAMELHRRSRRSGNIIFFDCNARTEMSPQERLFGRVHGHNGDTHAEGCIDAAVGGTLVLDNVDGLSDELQSVLSLFLDSGVFMRPGSDQSFNAALSVVGIVSDQAGFDSLHSDFASRISQISLDVPNLRECAGDVLMISHWLLSQCTNNQESYTMPDAMESQISAAPWPDNIRELRAAIQASVDQLRKFSSSLKELQLPERLRLNAWEPLNDSIGMTLRDFSTQLIVATLAHHHGDKAKTANTLGISLKTLYNRLNSY